MPNKVWFDILKPIAKFVVGVVILALGYKIASHRFGTAIPGALFFLAIFSWLMYLRSKGSKNGVVAQQLAREDAERRMNARR